MSDPVTLANEAVEISSINPTTGQEAILKLTLTVSVPVPEDGSVQVRLPKWISTDEGAPENIPMVSDSMLTSCHVHADTNPSCEISEDQ